MKPDEGRGFHLVLKPKIFDNHKFSLAKEHKLGYKIYNLMALHKIIEPNLSLIIQTPINEWFMVSCGLKNGCQKDTCLAKIGPSVQTLCTTLLSLIVNIIIIVGSPVGGGWLMRLNYADLLQSCLLGLDPAIAGLAHIFQVSI
jgi:hypothetical protein